MNEHIGMDPSGIPNLGEWPHLLLTMLVALVVWLLNRSVGTLDKRQDKAEEDIEDLAQDVASLDGDVKVLKDRTDHIR